MTNEIGKDVLATEDITGFSFHKISSKEARQEIRDIRDQKNAYIGRWVSWCIFCFILWSLVAATTEKGLCGVIGTTVILIIAVTKPALLLARSLIGARMRVSALLSGEVAKVELELVKKLHTKPKNSTNPVDDELFYPVIYQDTTSGHIGIFYVREEEYAKDIGSRIEAIKYNSFFLRDGYAVKNN